MTDLNKELQTIRNEMKATFKYIAHCEERTCDGEYQCHHIYDDQGNPQSLEELYDYVEKTIRRLLEERQNQTLQDIRSVKNFVSGGVEKQKILNYIDEYLLPKGSSQVSK